MGFKEDLEVGERYEDEVVDFLEVLFEKKFRRVLPETDPTFYKRLDIVEHQARKKPDLSKSITVECKFSSQDSPNVIVEYEAYGKPSGIAITMAAYYVFCVSRFHLLVKTDELLQCIINDLVHPDSHKKIKVKDFDKKKILIVPIKLILATCESAIKQLRFPVILEESITKEKKSGTKPVNKRAKARATLSSRS